MNPDGVTGGNIMEARYKKATIEDLDLLVDMRIKVLRAANMLSEETDMSEVRRCSYRYYKEALCNGSHTAYLVFDGNNVIGTGGASFFQVMPTYHNPSGYYEYVYGSCIQKTGSCLQNAGSFSP